MLTPYAHKLGFSKGSASYDGDVYSPKSVSVRPDGARYYVNSLEGCKTVVYDAATNKKVAVIEHVFRKSDSGLWAAPSRFFPFHHKYSTPNCFRGKPVEGTFSHGGRYFWVPYYRRSYDINAQDPSAIAVIDTVSHTIVRMLETGPLPKMVSTTPDGNRVVVTHWGDNTIGVIDVSDTDITQWHYDTCYTVDYQLKLNYSLTEQVNRDVNSGYCLRGTCFTPDSRYMMVCCMGGSGGIAVVDLQERRYLGRVLGCKNNVRHLVVHDGWLYLSVNNEGCVQRIPLDTIVASFDRFKNRTTRVCGWETCKVGTGARTISIAPNGRYLFAACNSSSCLAVVDLKRFKMVGSLPIDSYPVGLDISNDGGWVYITSQGRSGSGGNAVNIVKVEYTMPAEPPAPVDSISLADTLKLANTLVQQPVLTPDTASAPAALQQPEAPAPQPAAPQEIPLPLRAISVPTELDFPKNEK